MEPAKTAISPRSSPLGMFRAEEHLSKEIPYDDVKSVQNPVISADWTME